MITAITASVLISLLMVALIFSDVINVVIHIEVFSQLVCSEGLSLVQIQGSGLDDDLIGSGYLLSLHICIARLLPVPHGFTLGIDLNDGHILVARSRWWKYRP